MHARADGPDQGLARQCGEDLHRIISHYVVEPAHQSLVRTEHDHADAPLIASSYSCCHRRRPRASPETNAQPQLYAAIIVAECAHRSLVLADVRGSQGFHRANDGLEIAGAVDLAPQARCGFAHDRLLLGARRTLSRLSIPMEIVAFMPGLSNRSGLGTLMTTS